MSAFIVEPETINRILAGIHYSKSHRPYDWPRPHGELDVNVDDRKAMQYLGQRMLDMNTDAVEQRYNDPDTHVPPFVYRFDLPPSRIQLYKSLGCFLYQCSEGDVPATSQLYKDLDQFQNDLARNIVDSLPEYDRAEWA